MSSNLSSKAKAEFPRRSSRGAHVQCTPRRESTEVPGLRRLPDCSTNWSVTRLFCCLSAAHGHETHWKPKLWPILLSLDVKPLGFVASCSVRKLFGDSQLTPLICNGLSVSAEGLPGRAHGSAQPDALLKQARGKSSVISPLGILELVLEVVELTQNGALAQRANSVLDQLGREVLVV